MINVPRSMMSCCQLRQEQSRTVKDYTARKSILFIELLTFLGSVIMIWSVFSIVYPM